ncbi:thermonuclease family protein [Blastomonas sp.]|uniref:thermonuclease family protein n=1 Tax=Blastomonas sp. TaxID=1909299 RepID=UPI002636700F|nr:thermonuclease family protein [Blastomonas sp.]MDM7956923.1 thermonuclease family protein [Blastomonas sp.]
MAKSYPVRSRKAEPDFTRLIVLAMLLAALIGWNLNAWLMPLPQDAAAPASLDLASAQPDAVSVQFGICGGGARVTCVVDGDTIWLRGQKIRIADIDTPEISSPRCPAELERGRRATHRLVELLNTGPFTLEPVDRAQDRYGRALFVVARDGVSVGGALVDEGLAVWYGNGRPDWC